MRGVKLQLCISLGMLLTLLSCQREQMQTSPPSPVVQQPATPLVKDFAVPVLMYHRICELTPREARSPLMRDLTVSPADFAEQVRYLTANNFTILTVEQVEAALRDGAPLPERAVAITMDDGYKDNFACAFPILNTYRSPATVFVVTSVVDDAAHLSWDDIGAMRPRCTFESHSVHHYDLTTLPSALLDSELRDAKATLETHLATPVTQIAYPSGAYNTTVTEAARAAGYHIGWKKGGGPVRPGDDPYLLPRIRVHGRTTMKDFERKVWSGVNTIAVAKRMHRVNGEIL